MVEMCIVNQTKDKSINTEFQETYIVSQTVRFTLGFQTVNTFTEASVADKFTMRVLSIKSTGVRIETIMASLRDDISINKNQRGKRV